MSRARFCKHAHVRALRFASRVFGADNMTLPVTHDEPIFERTIAMRPPRHHGEIALLNFTTFKLHSKRSVGFFAARVRNHA